MEAFKLIWKKTPHRKLASVFRNSFLFIQLCINVNRRKSLAIRYFWQLLKCLLFRKLCGFKFMPIVESGESIFRTVCTPKKNYQPSLSFICRCSKNKVNMELYHLCTISNNKANLKLAKTHLKWPQVQKFNWHFSPVYLHNFIL